MAQKVCSVAFAFLLGSSFTGLLLHGLVSAEHSRLVDYQPQGGEPPIPGRSTASGC